MPLESTPTPGSRSENTFSDLLEKPLSVLREEVEAHKAKEQELEEELALLKKLRGEKIDEGIVARFEEDKEMYRHMGETGKEALKKAGEAGVKAAEKIGEGLEKTRKAATLGAVAVAAGVVFAPQYHNPHKHGRGEGVGAPAGNKKARTEQTAVSKPSRKDSVAVPPTGKTIPTTSPRIDTLKTVNLAPDIRKNDTIAGIDISAPLPFTQNQTPQQFGPRPIPPIEFKVSKDTASAPPEKQPALEPLPTGYPDMPFNPASVPPAKRGRITVENDTTAHVPSSGIPHEWTIPGLPKTPEEPPKKNEQVPPPMKIIPASPGNPDPKIIDPSRWPGSAEKLLEQPGTVVIDPSESADDDSTEMEINQYDRIQDSTRPKIEKIVDKGAEKASESATTWDGGHSSFKLETVAPGYELHRVPGFPNQDEIDAFAAPSGREIKMPDPEMKRTSTGLLIPRKLYENFDPKLFAKLEPDPVPFEIYEINQTESKSNGAYILETNGVEYVINKDGMLLFEIPAPKNEQEPEGRSFVKLVKGKEDPIGHLEINGKPLEVSKMEMEQLVRNCIQPGAGEKGFYFYRTPDNSEAYKNGKTRETRVKHINYQGDVEEITLGELHDREQFRLTQWHMDPNHFVRYYKKTQEYHAANGEFAGTFEGIEREKSVHMRRKVKTIVEKNRSAKGPLESDFKPAKKTGRAPNRSAKEKKK